jgi:hypothetical protein
VLLITQHYLCPSSSSVVVRVIARFSAHDRGTP